MEDFLYLGDARWADPERMTSERVEHVPVHVYRHRTTGQLHVILFDEERAVSAPTYIVKENELILPAGGLREHRLEFVLPENEQEDARVQAENFLQRNPTMDWQVGATIQLQPTRIRVYVLRLLSVKPSEKDSGITIYTSQISGTAKVANFEEMKAS